jgi:hypothetical protein
MRSLTKDLPNLGRSKIQIPEVDLSEVDLSKLEFPDVRKAVGDAGQAVGDAAVAAGIVRRRRSPWRLALGVAIVVGLTSWAYRNSAAIQERLGRLTTWIGDRVSAMQMPVAPAPTVDHLEAFTSEYPDRFEQPSEMGGMPDDGIPAFDELRARA